MVVERGGGDGRGRHWLMSLRGGVTWHCGHGVVVVSFRVTVVT